MDWYSATPSYTMNFSSSYYLDDNPCKEVPIMTYGSSFLFDATYHTLKNLKKIGDTGWKVVCQDKYGKLSTWQSKDNGLTWNEVKKTCKRNIPVYM